MDILAINGAAIPAPDDVGIEVNDISKAERNALGTMIIETIATKYKFSLKYSVITKEQLAALLALIKTVPFDVTFTDPETDEVRTSSFYPGTRSFGLLNIVNGVRCYKDMSVNIIER